MKLLEESLLTGEIAFKLERELVKHILAGTNVNPRSIYQLQIAISGVECSFLGDLLTDTNQRDTAKANWQRLGRTFKFRL